MPNYQQYNKKLFARWAPIYDGFELILYDVRKRITQQIRPTGKAVLDVATGTGSLAIALSSEAKSVVGIDLSAEMLEVARKKKGRDNLSFLEMDATEMDFKDDSFDVVTISLGLHDMPLEVRTAVLKETKRVLKKGGMLYVLEHDSPSNEWLRWITLNLIDTFESKYYLEFMDTDLVEYLHSFGFKMEGKTNFLLGHLQLLTLAN